MSHLNVLILVIYTIFCQFKIDLSGNTVWPQASGFQKLDKIDYFWHFEWTFVHSKCKCSWLRSHYCMRLFSVIFKHCAMMKIVLQFSKIDVFLLTFYFGCNVGFLSDISAHFSWYDFLSSPPSSCDWQNNEVNLIGNWPLKQILAILLQQNRRKNKLQSIRSRFNPQINLRTD